jgi:uncharacterized membrane protein YfcA
MIVVALALSLLSGMSLGMLGGGGSILIVPILVYVLGLLPKTAIAMSLVVVGVTSSAALIPHALAGRVHFRTGLWFGLAGMLGAYLGGRVAHHIPVGVLLTGFGAMMLITALAMLRGRRAGPEAASACAEHEHRLPLAKALLHGFLVGTVTGVLGAGGGFLIVPALVLLGGLPIRNAVATSLLVIIMNSLSGLAGYLGHAAIDWQLAGLVSATAIAGSLIGARLANSVPQERLRKLFGWFVLAMGLFVLSKQLPEVLAHEADWIAVMRTLPYALGLLMSVLAYRIGLARGANQERLLLTLAVRAGPSSPPPRHRSV